MQKRLRIIQVVNVRWFNATAWYGLSLASLLRGAGHDVLVIGLRGADSFAKAVSLGLEPRHVSLNTVNPLVVSRLYGCMQSLLRDFRPHVVNCHRGEGMLFWGLLKKSRHPFALVRTRGDQRPPKNNLPNRLLHATVADAVIATNSRTAKQCRDLFGLDDKRLFTIPGGVDTHAFRPDPQERQEVRARLGFTDEDVVVGLLGRFDAVKGQKELIEALGVVECGLRESGASRAGRVRLLLIGVAASLDVGTVESWLAGAGLAEHCVITGRIDNVRAHINAMDLGVIASQGSEAIARAAFEIMACNVPLIGTSVGVMPDLLEPRALVPPGDAGALTAMLRRAIEQDDFRRELALEQCAAMPKFTHEAFLQKSLMAYEAAMRRCKVAD